MKWDTKTFKKLSGNNFYVIEGLPGMGNVGKIAVDFIIDSLKADKVLEIYSSSFPHCVFVNEKNLVDMPSIKIYHKKVKSKDFIFIAGDIQPLDEASCYEFCEFIIDLLNKNKIKEIITLGGIGQPQIPKNPKLYCTGNNKAIIKKYSSAKLSNKIYGIVGPIIGVSGLLLGIANQRNIPALAILAETYGNPTYLGVKGARETLKLLNQELNLKLKLNKIEKEIESIEKNINNKKMGSVLNIKTSKKSKTDVNYIG
jgi:uncharacterized protein